MLVVHILTQIVFPLPNFTKSIDFCWMVSLWCKLLSMLTKLSIYTSKSNQWITIIMVSKPYFNSKFKVTCLTGDLMPVYTNRSHSEEKNR